MLDLLAKEIAPDDMDTIAIRYLDFKMVEVKTVCRDYREDLASCKRAILRTWGNKNYKDAKTVSEIICHFQSMKFPYNVFSFVVPPIDFHVLHLLFNNSSRFYIVG